MPAAVHFAFDALGLLTLPGWAWAIRTLATESRKGNS